MDALCLVSSPRTGTAQLFGMLRNFVELAPFGGAFGQQDTDIDEALWPALRKATGLDFANLRDPQLAELRQDRPGAWLDALEAASREMGKRLLSFRLWPGELPLDIIESEVVPRPGLRVVVVMRRQIDAYVSWRTDIEIGEWQGTDATTSRLHLDIDHFERWLDRVEAWYRIWRDLLARRYLPCPVVRYEIDIDIPVERVLRRFASAAALVGVTLRQPATIGFPGLERQDKAQPVADRVANWPAFSRELVSRGLERRAFGYPI